MIETPVISWSALVYAAVTLMAVWGFVKIVMEIIDKITKRHDREQAWDKAVEQIADERKQITDRYDERLNKIDKEIKSIKDEQCLIMEGQLAILDGLNQLNCNGPVSEMRVKIDTFLNKKAHKEEV